MYLESLSLLDIFSHHFFLIALDGHRLQSRTHCCFCIYKDYILKFL